MEAPPSFQTALGFDPNQPPPTMVEALSSASAKLPGEQYANGLAKLKKQQSASSIQSIAEIDKLAKSDPSKIQTTTTTTTSTTSRPRGRPKGSTSKSPSRAPTPKDAIEDATANSKRRITLASIVRKYIQNFAVCHDFFSKVKLESATIDELTSIIASCQELITDDLALSQSWDILKLLLQHSCPFLSKVLYSYYGEQLTPEAAHYAKKLSTLDNITKHIVTTQETEEKRSPGKGPLTPELIEISILYGSYLPKNPFFRLGQKLFYMTIDALALQESDTTEEQKKSILKTSAVFPKGPVIRKRQ